MKGIKNYKITMFNDRVEEISAERAAKIIGAVKAGDIFAFGYLMYPASMFKELERIGEILETKLLIGAGIIDERKHYGKIHEEWEKYANRLDVFSFMGKQRN